MNASSDGVRPHPAASSVDDYARTAREVLPRGMWETLIGDHGAPKWRTNTNNVDGFRQVALRPRVLADVSSLKTATSVLGVPVDLPILVAPSGAHQRYHPEGELATARGADRAGTIMSLSTVSTFSIEEVAAVAGPRRWFQLYLFRDRRITQHLIRRAEDSGYTALVITVDVPGTQTNERDVRFAKRGYSFTDETRMAPHLQPDRVLRNFQDVRLAGFELPTPGGLPAFFDSSFTWDDLEELRRTTSLPIVIKGIQCGEDAARCRELGVDGLVVSNHGGFALADASPTVRLLPEVVEAAGSVEVYLDGGVRHGTDVLKSLALGARAVLIGRAQIWGLAVAGEHGVSDVLRILRDELEQAMRHCGAADVAHVSPDLARVCPSLAAPQ